jgi:hypothetical protein
LAGTTTTSPHLTFNFTELKYSTFLLRPAPPFATIINNTTTHSLTITYYLTMTPNSNTVDGQVNFIVRVHTQGITQLMRTSRRLGDVPAPTGPKVKDWYKDLHDLLSFLEHGVRMTHHLKARTKVDEALRVIFDRADVHFPPADVHRARTLYARFESVGWNEPIADDVDMEDADSGVDLAVSRSPQRRVHRQSPGSASVVTHSDVKLPPANHSIWGR